MSEAPKLTPRDVIKEDDLSTWDKAWQAKVTPWDAGKIQPPLKEVVEDSGLDLPRSGRALVPGCGGGYDAVYLASTLGLETLGVDIAETAVETANRYLATTAPSASVTFKLLNFFSFKVPDDEKFDLVYDYTFFVAIPPSLRNEWGRQMTSLIKPGGYLITLVYPIDPPIESGPPYFLRPEHYVEPLGNAFEKVLDKDPIISSPTHVGRERIVVWRRL